MDELLLIQNKYSKQSEDITLLAVFKNEELLLPYFIEHYQKIGINNFIMIDNDSSDASCSYLLSLANINITLYHTLHSYKESNFGTTWINGLLDLYCKNKWCIVVDIDELLQLPYNCKSIQSLIIDMENCNSNIMYQLM